jgi:hypothetical protein
LEDVEELPEDLETNPDYLCLPSKKELDLGRDVVFSFVEESMPDEWDTVRGYFSRAGAYGRFKDLLVTRGKLEAWYRWEEAKTLEALTDWCEEHGLQIGN